MRSTTFAVLFSLAALGAAETTVDADDVPMACRNICQATIDLSRRCELQADNDNSNEDDDIVYNNCFCKEPSAQARISECATCVKANGMANANDDNEVAELMRDCGWDFAAANTTGGPVPTPTGSSTGSTGTTATPSVSTGLTLVPTTITTGGVTATVSTPSVVSTTIQPTSVPAGGAMVTPAVQGLLVAGIAAALF